MPVPAYAVGDVCEVVAMCYDPETVQLGLNVYHAKCAAVTGGGVSDQDIADRVDNDVNALYKAVLADDSEYYGITARNLFGVPLPAPSFSIGNRGVGLAGGVTAPDQLAPFARFLTGVAGRTGRGRKYFPFMPLIFIDVDNKITAASQVLYQALTTYFSTDITIVGVGTAVFQWGGYNRVTFNFLRWRVAIMELQIATQRRRGAFGRTNQLPVPS